MSGARATRGRRRPDRPGRTALKGEVSVEPRTDEPERRFADGRGAAPHAAGHRPRARTGRRR